MLSTIIKKLGTREDKTLAPLAAAATTGVSIARFLGKRSIYGAIVGIGVGLVVKKIMKKQEEKQNLPVQEPQEI
ncbi:hypothetical protein [Weeksella virosa]|uniref:Uncharacterized protein n=1 Tax=Weeksella virosa (strain ATCC 43766 / DSM 16922 / JCM 21250 / CCUG 30538 / CDC 9751 / IAM 14551 / NBRC 16016 / NCTC 11634 / CL345/78) TaxID=865938 RepID=F0P067_WEEVC|nr:hypothetical protein [Weeksella virosa]ADX68427.1 hypothetical protein Weevi_1735 [Weeksella virosa DSM 16922]MDK7375518.1 hypothetical protein [Weeksella virosa]MDK7674607.1 hypothetical protein [Weeksella virosa]VEH63918.1 Uncharacterised protein [Weeksella virosa]